MIRKPTYLYSFISSEESEKFLKQANNHYASAFAQHPQINGNPNVFRVLVTGTGSLTYDIALKNYLDSQASELNGFYIPKSSIARG